jgi:ribosome-associated toxin RatA of RatAB toxin-antitoxin module
VKDVRSLLSRTLYAVLIALVCASVFDGAALAAAVKEPAWKKMDINALVGLLAKGDLVSVEKLGGGGELSTIGMLVNAPPEKLWNAITDFEGYPKIVPSCASVKITQRYGNMVVVDFIVRVIKIGPIDITTDYTLRYNLKKPKRVDISWVKGSVKNVSGYWEIIPVAGGKKSVMVYGITSNLKEASAIAKMALQKQPSTETAINLSSAIVLTKAAKKKAESK